MKLRVDTTPRVGRLPGINYCWDAETNIFAARLRYSADEALPSLWEAPPPAEVLELAGHDGSWIYFELAPTGLLAAIEVAVWPLLTRATLEAPVPSGVADVRLRPGLHRGRRAPLAGLEAQVFAAADSAARLIRFNFGKLRAGSIVQPAAELLMGLDERGALASLWLLDVPAGPVSGVEPRPARLVS